MAWTFLKKIFTNIPFLVVLAIIFLIIPGKFPVVIVIGMILTLRQEIRMGMKQFIEKMSGHIYLDGGNPDPDYKKNGCAKIIGYVFILLGTLLQLF